MESPAFLFRGSQMDFCDSLPLISCAETAACQLPESDWEGLNCLALGKCWRCSFLSGSSAGRIIVTLVRIPPTCSISEFL